MVMRASVVKIETFILYFGDGDVYLWDRDSNDLEPLALQVGTTPLSADAVKMLTQTAANTHQLALQNRAQSYNSLRSSSRASSRASGQDPVMQLMLWDTPGSVLG